MYICKYLKLLAKFRLNGGDEVFHLFFFNIKNISLSFLLLLNTVTF